MKKHMAKLLAALLAAIMLLPATVQAAPADGWTDEAEQAYQTVTQLVIQRVTESKDYLAAATQEENAKTSTPCGPPAQTCRTDSMTSTYRRWRTGWTLRQSAARRAMSPVLSARWRLWGWM